MLGRWAGTVVTVAFEALALGFLVSRPQVFAGPAATWAFTLGVYAALPLVTLVMATVPSPWPRRVLLAKALVVFWATLPETALLPARWLVHAALATQAVVLPRRGRPWAVGAVALELVLVQNLLPGMTVPPVDPIITTVVVVLVVVPAFLVLVGQDLKTRLEALEAQNDSLHAAVLQLTSANTEFLEQANTASQESAVLERHRITRELHDVVGQTLTNIIMMMDASLHRKAHEPEETVKLLKWIRQQAREGLEETRAVLYELRSIRPRALRGLQALKKLTETFARLSRIQTKVEWGNLPWTFDPDQEKAVYYLVQGSLSNAFRHGSATLIDLHFQVDQGVLHVMIRDNGKGGADSSLGLGQKGMEERLAQWGGVVGFQSETYGYVVTATLPLVEAPSQEDHEQAPHR